MSAHSQCLLPVQVSRAACGLPCIYLPKTAPSIQGDQEAVCPPDLSNFCGVAVNVGQYSFRRNLALAELIWSKLVILPGPVWPAGSPLLTFPIYN